MILTLNRKRITVISIAEAQLKVHEESERVGSTEFYTRNPVDGCPVHSGDMLLGRISYNAKFWPANDSNPTSTHDSPPTEGGVMNAKIKKSKTPVPAAKKAVKKNPAAEAFWNQPAAPTPEPEKDLPKMVVKDGHATIEEPGVETPATEPEIVTGTTKKAARKAKAAAEAPGDQKPAAPPAELVVFALRMSLAERTQLHAAAGPAKATKFARAILIAASTGDEARIHEIIEATRTTK